MEIWLQGFILESLSVSNGQAKQRNGTPIIQQSIVFIWIGTRIQPSGRRSRALYGNGESG